MTTYEHELLNEHATIYRSKKINGLNYVRHVKNERNEICGFFLTDNQNKPVLDTFLYTKQCIIFGAQLNTLKRYIYDLLHFYDYMLVNDLSPGLVTASNLCQFAGIFLRIIDKNFKTRDPIERSMLENMPIREAYQSSKIIDIPWQGSNSFSPRAVKRIIISLKVYYKFLVDTSKISQEHYDSLFPRNSINSIIKAAKIPLTRNEISPVEYSQVFQQHEIKAFFDTLQGSKENPCTKLYFYLLRISGMRESDPRRLRFNTVVKKKNETGILTYDFTTMDSDIVLIDPKEKIWRIQIKYYPNDPPDLALKRGKERYIEFSDKIGQFEFLLIRALFFREMALKQNFQKHDFLLVGRSGKRLLSRNMSVLFYKLLRESDLQKRIGRNQLVLHSFRHTFASIWIRQISQGIKRDIELHLLSKILGHSSYKFTLEQYCHFFEEDYRKILQRMEEVQFNDTGAYRIE